MKTVLITGANRGLGLEFARQYLADGWHVIATARNPTAASALKALPGTGKLEVIAADICQPDTFANVAQQVAGLCDHLDLLINNAGVFPDASRSADVTPGAMDEAFRVNTVGAVFFTRALVPLLEKSENAVVVNISSTMGSIESKRDEGAGGDYAYSISKAALNMATRLMANDLVDKGITVVAQCPGWVQTDMGGANATLKPEQSISAMRATFASLKIGDTGRFQNRHGEVIAY